MKNIVPFTKKYFTEIKTYQLKHSEQMQSEICSM